MTSVLLQRIAVLLAAAQRADSTWLCDCNWDTWLPVIHDMLRLFPNGFPTMDAQHGSDPLSYLVRLRTETCPHLLVGDKEGFDFFARLKDAGRVHGHGWDTFAKVREICPVGVMVQHLLCAHAYPEHPSGIVAHHVDSVWWLIHSLAFREEADGITMNRHIEPDFPFPQCFQYGSPWRLLFDKLPPEAGGPPADSPDVVGALLGWVQRRQSGEGHARFTWRFTPEYKQVGLQDHLERCLPVKNPGCFSGDFTCAACCAGGERGDPQCWAAGYTFEVCCR